MMETSTNAVASLQPPEAATKRWLRWSGILGRFATLQLVIQAVNAVAGLLIVRLLGKADFAIYTIALSMLSLMTSLSDVGVGNALLALGGKVWPDHHRLARLIVTGRKLRGLLIPFSIAITIIPLSWLCLKAGSTWMNILWLSSLLIGSAYCQLDSTIWGVVLRLNSRIQQMQVLELSAGITRLCLIGISALSTINAVIVVGINFIGSFVQTLVAGHWGRSQLPAGDNPGPNDRSAILSLVKNQLPNSIFYCVHGQITVVIISVFGQTGQIADVGALARLAVLFAMFGSMLSTILLPRFAKARTPTVLRTQYCQMLGSFLVLALILVAGTLAFPRQILWVLGQQYANLTDVVGWMVVATLINAFVGMVWSMNAARGWLRGAWWTIPYIVAAQILSAMVLDLSTVKGAVCFGSLPLLAALIVLFRLAYRGLRDTE